MFCMLLPDLVSNIQHLLGLVGVARAGRAAVAGLELPERQERKVQLLGAPELRAVGEQQAELARRHRLAQVVGEAAVGLGHGLFDLGEHAAVHVLGEPRGVADLEPEGVEHLLGHRHALAVLGLVPRDGLGAERDLHRLGRVDAAAVRGLHALHVVDGHPAVVVALLQAVHAAALLAKGAQQGHHALLLVGDVRDDPCQRVLPVHVLNGEGGPKVGKDVAGHPLHVAGQEGDRWALGTAKGVPALDLCPCASSEDHALVGGYQLLRKLTGGRTDLHHWVQLLQLRCAHFSSWNTNICLREKEVAPQIPHFSGCVI
mmetsp:Transcript_44572/g.72710  ORF Transcript_44572/g.72710 Transcript_44572/m.72710 type:complete len:315 (+) Transcript_44572:1327-2271(+)